MLATEHTETYLGFLGVLCGKKKMNDAAILRDRLVCDPLRFDRCSLPGQQEQVWVPDIHDREFELGDVRFDRRQLGDRFWKYDFLFHAPARFLEMAS